MKQAIKKDTNNTLIKVISIILLIVSALCIFLIISLHSTKLLPTLIGLLLLILLMNIAEKITINKEKVKMWSIINIIMIICSISLLTKYIIFSLVLSVPAFIISKNLIQKNSKLLITKIAYFASLVVVLLGIGMSIVSIIMSLINTAL